MHERSWIMGFVGIAIILVGGGVIYKIKSEQRITKPIVGESLLSEPIIKITDPQRGPADALITIVYFTDFGCDSCAEAWPVLKTLEQDSQFKGKLRFVWKDFPAHKNVFPESFELHKAGRCAAVAGKFWEFQEAAFLHIQEIRLREPVLKKIIEEVGLDGASIQNCMQSPGIESAIADTEREGKRLSITATPTLFFSGKRFDELPPYYVLAGNIRNEIAKIENERAMKK